MEISTLFAQHQKNKSSKTLNNYWIDLATIAGVHLLAVASPGPDLAVTVRQSLKFGKTTGIQTAIGIGTGILIHVAYILFGFAFILSQNQKVYTLFKYGAAAYLLYLAFMSLRAKAPTDTILQNQENNSALPSFFQAFKVGFITNAFNPKASLFFLSVYTAIIHPQTPILIQTGYGVYMAIATALWFSLVSVLFGNQSLRSAFFSHSHWVERLIGLVLIALAVGLILP